MAERKPTHFWEGKDSRDRLIRASFNAERAPFQPGLFGVGLPAIVFRQRKEWVADPHETYRESRVEAINRYRVGTNRRLLPPPRQSGVVFTFLLAMSLKDFQYQAKHGIALGLEKKHRPSMARLSAKQLFEINVALDFWMEHGGESSMVPALRKSHEVQPKETP